MNRYMIGGQVVHDVRLRKTYTRDTAVIEISQLFQLQSNMGIQPERGNLRSRKSSHAFI